MRTTIRAAVIMFVSTIMVSTACQHAPTPHDIVKSAETLLKLARYYTEPRDAGVSNDAR